MRLIVEHSVGCERERDYILHTVLGEFLGLKYCTTKGIAGRTTLRLAGDESTSLVMPDIFFDAATKDWLGESTKPREPLATWHPTDAWFKTSILKHSMPVLFGAPIHNDAACDSHSCLDIDVFGSVFFMLTRYEEAYSQEQGLYNNFPATASLGWRNNFLLRPLVNEYVEVLWDALHTLWPRLERTPRHYRVLPGHDVDVPLATSGIPFSRVAMEFAGDLLKRHDTATAFARLKSWANTLNDNTDGDLYNTFDFLMDTAEQNGLATVFFLYAGGGVHARNPNYQLDDIFIKTLCRRISERGHEIAIHPGYVGYCDATAIVNSVARLSEMLQQTCNTSDIKGSRQHYLRWSPELSWRNLAEAGLQYDATLGFNEQLGFRCGTCWEYPVYDLFQRHPIQLRERPLLFMDVTVLRHQNMEIDEIVNAASDLANTCRQFSGDFTMLWHNNFLTSAVLRECYKSIMTDATVGT